MSERMNGISEVKDKDILDRGYSMNKGTETRSIIMGIYIQFHSLEL